MKLHLVESLPHLFILGGCGLVLVSPLSSKVTIAQAAEPVYVLNNPEVLGTQTRFSEELTEKKTVLDFKVIREIDPERDACEDEAVTQEGKNGEKRTFVRVIYYDGEKYDEEIAKTEVTPAIGEIRVKGSKKIYKSLDTPQGQVQYWCKLENFLATSYDSCLLYTSPSPRD